MPDLNMIKVGNLFGKRLVSPHLSKAKPKSRRPDMTRQVNLRLDLILADYLLLVVIVNLGESDNVRLGKLLRKLLVYGSNRLARSAPVGVNCKKDMSAMEEVAGAGGERKREVGLTVDDDNSG